VNGKFVGGWPYGYASWRVDLTPHLKTGNSNLVAIRLDNPPDSSRWYPGGGIYRNVWLVKTSPIHISQYGVHVTTPSVSRTAATAALRVKVENHTDQTADLQVTTKFYPLSAKGEKSSRAIALTAHSAVQVAAGGSGTTTLTAEIVRPQLWSTKAPNRYVAVTEVEHRNKLVDACETPFGIRTIQFTAKHGFLLNGERVAINGVCNHHDLGALGAALNVRALERQIELLQEMGCNAIRTSHNPPAPELLDLCDRMGMVVMDEAFDCWVQGKKKNDYHLLFPDWHEKDVRAFVCRDRNHPSVVLWSIGNEIAEQGSPEGHKIAAQLAQIVRAEDPTRPVTAGCNNANAGYNGFQKTVDVFGYNYKPGEYGKFRTANPDQPILGSETSSCVSSRGEYFFPVVPDKLQGRANFQVSSYDLYAPPWAFPPDREFRGLDEFPFVGGEFVWTGFDYLGEPTPYNADSTSLLNFTDPAERKQFAAQLKELGKISVPSRSSYFGIIDLAGFKKDRFYLYQSRWIPTKRMAHILPHWTWPERVGKLTPVHVYTAADEAELFLNNTSLGKKKRGPLDYRLRWDNVIYQPGILRVVAYKNGNKWTESSVRTAGPAAVVQVDADRSTIAADGQDLSFVTVTITDQTGQLVPRSHNQVIFELEGPGEIVAVDNGDPTSFEPFKASERRAFNGQCLAIIRSVGEPGAITLKATSPGLAPATVKIRTRATD
jgi:beta-galactosidase